MARPRFDLRVDAGREMVAATQFTYNGVDYDAGDPFAVEDLDPRRVATLHGARRINFINDRQQDARDERRARREELTRQPAVKIEAQPGGYYEITAPWLDGPERARGKGKAEARVAELTAEGPPLGFIEGGTVTTIEESGGGWYDVSAPWLDKSVKAQGREAAEAEQLKLHEAGEPAEHHGVTLTEGENGWWTITRPEFDGKLKIQGEERAREAAATLRRGELIEGQPAEWTPEPLKPGDVVLVAHDGSVLDGLTGTLETIDGEQARVVALKDAAEEGGDQESVEDTVPLTSLTLAPPAEPAAGDETPADDKTADGAETGDTAPAPELPEGGGPQTAEAPPAGPSEGDDNDET